VESVLRAATSAATSRSEDSDAGGRCASVVSDADEIGSFAVDAKNVYYATPPQVMGGPTLMMPGAIKHAPKDGMGAPVVIAKLQVNVTSLATDGVWVYWVSGPVTPPRPRAAIRRQRADTAAGSECSDVGCKGAFNSNLIPAQQGVVGDDISQIVVDAEALYWATSTANGGLNAIGKVYKIGKWR
jgi:hypothetical protein